MINDQISKISGLEPSQFFLFISCTRNFEKIVNFHNSMKIKVTEILHVNKKKENKLYFLKILNKNILVFLLYNARKTCIFMRTARQRIVNKEN